MQKDNASSAPYTGPERTLKAGGHKFRARVMNPATFRLYMLVKMPPLGVTGTYLKRLDLEACEAFLPFGWGSKDLFGNLASASIEVAAEITAASLWVLHIRNESADVQPIPTHVAMKMDRTVREAVRLRTTGGWRHGDVIDEVVERGEAVEIKTTTTVHTAKGGEKVGSVVITWSLEPK